MVDDHTTTGLGRDATCQAGGPSWGLIALGQAICQVRLALLTFFFILSKRVSLLHIGTGCEATQGHSSLKGRGGKGHRLKVSARGGLAFRQKGPRKT